MLCPYEIQGHRRKFKGKCNGNTVPIWRSAVPGALFLLRFDGVEVEEDDFAVGFALEDRGVIA